MRRLTFAGMLFVASAGCAYAQTSVPHVFFAVGDGIGTTNSAGGLGGSTSMAQVFRASMIAAINNEHGIDVTAFHLQTVIPSKGRLRNPADENPGGDGIVLSYASLSPDRRSSIPASLSIGVGIVRLHFAATPDSVDKTWVGRLAYDPDPQWRLGRWGDIAFGGQFMIMPAQSTQMLVTTINASIRLR